MFRLRRKYMLVQRDQVSRGLSIVSFHWFKWAARVKGAHLKARHARQFAAWQAPRFDWEVDKRCA